MYQPFLKKSIFLFLSILSYVASLFVPAFGSRYFGFDSFRYTIEYGYEILIFTGWAGVLVMNFAWFANLTYFIALILSLLKKKLARVYALLSFFLGLSALLLYFKRDNTIGLYPGYYLWISSFLLLLLHLRTRD